MSIELAADKFEIRDDATDGLVLNHATKLIPVVQEVNLANIDVAFPDVSKGVYVNMNTGTKGTSTSSPNDRSWRSYAWGLRINGGKQEGAINLVPIASGLAPNLIMGNVRLSRIANPREDVFGPFLKSPLENTWMPFRSGARLESNAWMRRIVWFDISGGFLRLNWKQSTRFYSPNGLDPNWASSWPQRYTRLSVPPAYQIGSSYQESPSDTIFPPPQLPAPDVNSGPGGVISFASTWRFTNINIQLMQL